MADYRTLELKDEDKTITDYDHIPEQRGEFKPLVQPGDFLLELPKNIATAWTAFDCTVDEKQVQRVACQFDGEHPLTIVGSRDPRLVGEWLQLRVSNAERNRARKGDPKALVSDMLYLLREGLGADVRPKSNREWIKAMNENAGAQFVASLTWSSYCNDRQTRYIEDENGQSVEDPDGTKGCGARYYQRDIPKDELGNYVERFACTGKRDGFECGASLRAFGNLERFRRSEGWAR
jgi:hypothetical protein